MEFSATLPVDLAMLAEGFAPRDPAIVSSGGESAPFVAFLDSAGSLLEPELEVEIDGEVVPLPGKPLPVVTDLVFSPIVPGAQASASLAANLAGPAAPGGPRPGQPAALATPTAGSLTLGEALPGHGAPTQPVPLADPTSAEAFSHQQLSAPRILNRGGGDAAAQPLPVEMPIELDETTDHAGLRQGRMSDAHAAADPYALRKEGARHLGPLDPVQVQRLGLEDSAGDGQDAGGFRAGARSDPPAPVIGPAKSDSAGQFSATAVQTQLAEPRVAATGQEPGKAQFQNLQFDLERGPQIEQLAGRIRWLADQNIGEARIRLNPPELGAIEIRLSLVDDETFVQISALHSGARDLLEGSLEKLRSMLGAGGLSLGGASVDDGAPQTRAHSTKLEDVAADRRRQQADEAVSTPAAQLRRGAIDLYA